MRTFYVAAGKGDAFQARVLAGLLSQEGFLLTMDWTASQSSPALGTEGLRRRSTEDRDGISEADFVILLPGPDSLVQLGIAIGLRKLVIVYGDGSVYWDASCHYYHDPAVVWFLTSDYSVSEVAKVIRRVWMDVEPDVVRKWDNAATFGSYIERV